MKLFLFTLLLSVASAAEPIKITDAEKLKTRELELAVSRSEAAMGQAALQYQQAEKAREQLTAALAEHEAGLAKAYKCDGCTLDRKTLDLVPPKKAEVPKKEQDK